MLITHGNKWVARSLHWLVLSCTIRKLGYNHCLGATADRTELYTANGRQMTSLTSQKSRNYTQLIDNHSKYTQKLGWVGKKLLTLGWFVTIQCSQTFTRCSKQNWLVTLLFGHLQRPIVMEVFYSSGVQWYEPGLKQKICNRCHLIIGH
jgi:hypothetical protein